MLKPSGTPESGSGVKSMLPATLMPMTRTTENATMETIPRTQP